MKPTRLSIPGAVRATIAVLATLLLIGGLIAQAACASAVESERGRLAVGWLHPKVRTGAPGWQPDSPDVGLTIDALWGLMAAGATRAQVDQVGDVVEEKGPAFASAEWDGTTYLTSGATGKVLLAAASLRRDPHRFGGADLRAAALGTVQPNGQVFDLTDGAPSGSGNLFAQSLVMMGLARTGDLPSSTVDFLVTQQCTAGFFRIFYYETPALSCDAGGGEPDRDATAMAVMALLAARDKGAATEKSTAALTRALAWLEQDQRPDGSFSGGVGTEGPNTNSTGLAAAALAAGGRTAAADKAGRWVASLQLTAENAGQASDSVGAIAYSSAALGDAQANGISPDQADQWLRATTQAILALTPMSLHQVSIPAGTPTPSATPTSTPSPAVTPTPTGTPQPGYAGYCTDGRGVTVVVDFQDLSPVKETVIRCAPNFPQGGTGLDALKLSGIAYAGVARWGDAFICRLEGRPAADEPITVPGNPNYTEKCINTPPAAAYWSYWHAGNGEQWEYSDLGVTAHQAVIGGFEGWSFSHNATAETNPVPRVAPVRPTTTPTVSPTPTPTASPTPARTPTRTPSPTPTPDSPITRKWNALGGARGPVGAARGPEVCGLRDTGCYREFVGGTIVDSAKTDPQLVKGAIRDKWISMGREAGRMGYPISDEICGLREGGCVSRFQGGLVYWSPTTGARAVFGAIGAGYAQVRWESSPLGYPIEDEFCGLRDGGCAQRFQGGLMYWSPGSGANPVWGAIGGGYAQVGWETSTLGYPIGAEFCGLRAGGCAQRFQGGLIYWTPASGAHPVWGSIGQRYADLRWETGQLGYPTSNEFCDLKEQGCFQRFQGGEIHWSPASGAWPTWGLIARHWAANGWETGRYGYPAGYETCRDLPDARECTQPFQGATVTWNSRTGTR